MIRTAVSTKPKVKKQKNNGSAIKGGVVLLLLVAMMVGYYYYLSNRESQKEAKVPKLTVAQELIARDLTNNYPPTPKEVVKFYSEITKCYYNDEHTQEELEQLASQARSLYDEELAANNDWNQYIMKLEMVCMFICCYLKTENLYSMIRPDIQVLAKKHITL